MSINRVVLQEGLMFSQIKRFNEKRDIQRFVERFGYNPDEVWINENAEIVSGLRIIKKKSILKNHYYLTKGT